jgi:uncharacterized protein YndB with AHSA1/START domain
MRRITIVAGGLILVVLVLMLFGSFLPREHRATCRATFRAEIETLYALLADFDAYPGWRTGVQSVRRVDPIDGKPAFVEESKSGPVRYAVEASEPPRKLVLRIADDSLPYGGTWTFALAPEADGTSLSITEDGFVEPALFRVLSRFVFGHYSSMEEYLACVARKLGETVTVERVE